MDLKPGDVVQLKGGGGPEMTVEEVEHADKGDKVTCLWFVCSQLERHVIDARALKKTEE